VNKRGNRGGAIMRASGAASTRRTTIRVIPADARGCRPTHRPGCPRSTRILPQRIYVCCHVAFLPAGFIAPCLPTKADTPPSGEMWLHEIKHDGFRIIARKDGDRVRLYSRPGNDMTRRFPLIVDALARLRSRFDGEDPAIGATTITTCLPTAPSSTAAVGFTSLL
jgi:ATP dependent DNA ligase domain